MQYCKNGHIGKANATCTEAGCNKKMRYDLCAQCNTLVHHKQKNKDHKCKHCDALSATTCDNNNHVFQTPCDERNAPPVTTPQPQYYMQEQPVDAFPPGLFYPQQMFAPQAFLAHFHNNVVSQGTQGVVRPRPDSFDNEPDTKHLRRDIELLQDKLRKHNIPFEASKYQESNVKKELQRGKEFLKLKIVLSNKGDGICFAIRVGPVTIMWDRDTSLCDIQLHYKEAVVFVGDIGTVVDKDEQNTVQDCIDDLAKLIHDWNHEQTYNAMSCNDHHFVKECQKVIKKYADVKVSESIKDYIRISKMFSRCLRCVIVPSEIQEKIKLDKLKELEFEAKTNMIKFKSHEELDKFVYYLRKKVTDEAVRQPFEAVLKGLDRGFWMCGEHTGKCPWKNPDNNPTTNWGISKRIASRNL